MPFECTVVEQSSRGGPGGGGGGGGPGRVKGSGKRSLKEGGCANDGGVGGKWGG